MSEAANKLIVIFGPTSSGKTDLSLRVARYIYGKYHFESEFISSDSRQIYQDMNIGTSKVDHVIRQKFPHHMIDILPSTGSYPSTQFDLDASDLIQSIIARGRIPILVGGTGAFVIPLAKGRDSQKDFSAHDTLILVPHFERPILYRKITRTVDQMFQRGLYAEVKGIVSKYHQVPTQLKKTHGYREFIEHSALTGTSLFKFTPQDLEKIKGKIKAHTKKYAMHQIGWLSKLPDHHVVKDWEEAKGLIDQFLS